MVLWWAFHLRLANWVKLVRTTIQAEVPHFEMLHTISSFLSSVSVDEKGEATAKRLAQAFGFNAVPRLRFRKWNKNPWTAFGWNDFFVQPSTLSKKNPSRLSAISGWTDLGSRACASTCKQLPEEGETCTLGGVGCGCSLTRSAGGSTTAKLLIKSLQAIILAWPGGQHMVFLSSEDLPTVLKCLTAYLEAHCLQWMG